MEISPDLLSIIIGVLFGGGVLEGTKYGVRKFRRNKITNSIIEQSDPDYTDPNFDRPVFNTECVVRHRELNNSVALLNETSKSMQKDLKTIIGFQVDLASLRGELASSLANLKNELVSEIKGAIERHEDREHPKK